MAYSNILILQ